jgi:hypothetical protein
VAGSQLQSLFHARAAFISQELREKTPPQHGFILVDADNGALQNDKAGARHSEKLSLVPPQPHAGAARSGCGVSRYARHTAQLLPRARGQRSESRRKVYEGRVWEQ